MREIRVASNIESDSAVEMSTGIEDFEAFYRQQRRSLIALAYAVSGSPTAAEDLAQEALVAAYESWDRIRAKENPGTWVRRILLNKASSQYRRRMTEAKVAGQGSVRRDQSRVPGGHR